MQSLRLLYPTLLAATHSLRNNTVLFTRLSLTLVDRHRQCWSLTLFRVGGRWLPDACIVIREMNKMSSLEVLLSWLAVLSVAHAATTVYLAALQCPLEILRFLNNNINLHVVPCGGRPLKFSEIRNFGVQSAALSFSADNVKRNRVSR